MLPHRTDDLRARFATLACKPDASLSLAEGAFLIAAEAEPELDVKAQVLRLDALAEAAWPHVHGLDDDRTRVQALLRFLYEDYGLRGNVADYYDPRNSYLNEVLDRRLGIPIPLATVIIEVGRRVGLDLRGVGFPCHFLVKPPTGIPGFIDPFDPSRMLTVQCCRTLLHEATEGRIPFDLRFLEPVGPRTILVRILRNLKSLHIDCGQPIAALADVDRILLLSPHESLEYRDRGLLRLGLGLNGPAADDLCRYLVEHPKAVDRCEIEERIEAARATNWNVS